VLAPVVGGPPDDVDAPLDEPATCVVSPRVSSPGSCFGHAPSTSAADHHPNHRIAHVYHGAAGSPGRPRVS
jgi:hypothetical protein